MEPTPLEQTFTCALCSGVFSIVDPEAARAELHANFPGMRVEDCVVICDDCFNRPGALERARADYQARN